MVLGFRIGRMPCVTTIKIILTMVVIIIIIITTTTTTIIIIIMHACCSWRVQFYLKQAKGHCSTSLT